MKRIVIRWNAVATMVGALLLGMIAGGAITQHAMLELIAH
jgi:hypothetical protein